MTNINYMECKSDCHSCPDDLKKLCQFGEHTKEHSSSVNARKLTRADICDIVKDTICGQRTDTHGNPENSFRDIAAMWTMYLHMDITADDVAVMMILLKICRYMDGKPVMDHLIDIAGYAAIAAEILSGEGAFDV